MIAVIICAQPATSGSTSLPATNDTNTAAQKHQLCFESIANNQLTSGLVLFSSSNILRQAGNAAALSASASGSSASNQTIPGSAANLDLQGQRSAAPLTQPSHVNGPLSRPAGSQAARLLGTPLRQPTCARAGQPEPASQPRAQVSSRAHLPQQATNKQLARSALFQEDEQESAERLSRMLEQHYGLDSSRAISAAIVIQRAFRKHQICKRFRTITEQLRQSGGSRPRAPNQQVPVHGLPEPPTQAAPELLLADNSLATSRPHALGSTRAAAWESLSQAANKLTSRYPCASPLTGAGNLSLSKQMAKAQQDPVVAAAINFQQLEAIRKRQYRVGLNIFNKNPEKGISFLIAHSFIDASSPFLKSSSTLSYYQSNQMHFIDSQQQQQLSHQSQQQSILHSNIKHPDQRLAGSTNASAKSNNLLLAGLGQSCFSCQLCYEEDNLKRNVAHFLLHRKGLAKEKIGHYLGNLQNCFNQDVLKYYLQELDFYNMQIDLALRKFLSTFRLPGEAQKIERIVDCFAQRYSQCQLQQPLVHLQSQQVPFREEFHGVLASQQSTQTNQTTQAKNNLILLTKDEIFILTFAIIMLNTDLHSPSLKPTSRMSANQFINNLRGIFKSQNINESDLIEIYERVKANQISTTPDHVNHVMKVQQGLTVTNFQRKELLPVSCPSS